MAPSCRLTRQGVTVAASWRRDGDTLILTPEGGAPFAVFLRAVSGIAGDGFRIALRYGGGTLDLERLGADGPPLLAALQRDWMPLRARALRLSRREPPSQVAGSITERGATRPFLAFFDAGLMLIAAEGEDLRPFFLARTAAIDFSADDHTVSAAAWDGTGTVFSRLAGRTLPFFEELTRTRAALAAVGADVLSRFLPTLDAAATSALAARWLPGRPLSLADLEEITPGFTVAFSTSWLRGVPRRHEGAHLLAHTPSADLFLGFSARLPQVGAVPEAAGAVAGAEAPYLCLLAHRRETWLLEMLSHEDYATYRFRGGGEMPELTGQLLSLPHFSREALYLPLEELTGPRADLALPARELPLLSDLRARFQERIIHSALDSWRREIG